MAKAVYTIEIEEKENCTVYLAPHWIYTIRCGEFVIAEGTARSEESAYIFAGSALSRISGQTTEQELHALEA